MRIYTVNLSTRLFKGQVQLCADLFDWRIGAVFHAGRAPQSTTFRGSYYFDFGLYVPFFSAYFNFWQPTTFKRQPQTER